MPTGCGPWDRTASGHSGDQQNIVAARPVFCKPPGAIRRQGIRKSVTEFRLLKSEARNPKSETNPKHECSKPQGSASQKFPLQPAASQPAASRMGGGVGKNSSQHQL
jgi:hypothetical protein